MCIKDTLEDDEPIPNMAKFFGQGQKEAVGKKKKKSESGVLKRQKMGKVEKVKKKKIFSRYE